MTIGKNKFLLTTAVLLAGVSLASVQGSAQGMREGAGGGMSAGGGAGGSASGGAGGAAERPSGATSHGAGGALHSEGSHNQGMTQGRAGGRAEGPSAAQESSRASDKGDKQTMGRDRDNSRQSQSEHQKQGKEQTVGQSPGGRDRAYQSKSESDKSGQKDQTVGQSRSDRDHTRQSQGAEQSKSTTTGANAQDKSAQNKNAQGKNALDKNAQGKNAQGKNAQGQTTTTTGANTRSGAQNRNAQDQSKTTTGANTGSNAQSQNAQGTTTGANTQGQTNAQAQTAGGATQSLSGRVQVNAQQQTQLQQSVLSSRNIERVRVNNNAINFRVDAGVVVPRNISVVSVSAFPVLIDIYPDYHDDSFFVVDDEIVVTDRSRRIVDVIPAGPRTHYAHRGSSSGGSSSVAALNLSPDEIRVVQRVLIERGMLSGEADGVLGPGTRRALMTFQRQEGFQATGSIDTRTVAALGVSNQISATQGQSTTVGQGGNNQSAPQNTTGQATGESNAPAQQNQTTGQAPQNQPSTTGQAQQNQPANSGQANTNHPSGQTTGQAPAQSNSQSNNQSTSQPGANPQTEQTNQNNAPPPSTTSEQPAKK
ncbi:hypothetical protein ABID59_002310 [Bradyrhizobium sp. S3.3.6]|uniref:peptidoglycan-binding protein n=1 Tax=Bradyrhizobium sp. S3.3.6 TaxID=3156429 RepID=UPI003399CF26